MFGGEEESVKVQFDNSLVNVVIDRFGKNINIEEVDGNSFTVSVKVAVSSTFYAWVFQFGDKVKILSPESVVKEYKDNLNKIIERYCLSCHRRCIIDP